MRAGLNMSVVQKKLVSCINLLVSNSTSERVRTVMHNIEYRSSERLYRLMVWFQMRIAITVLYRAFFRKARVTLNCMLRAV